MLYTLCTPSSRGGKAINLFCCFVVAFIYFFFHTLHCYCRDPPAAAKPGKPSKPLFSGKKQQAVSSGHYLSRELRGTAHQRPKPCLKSKENTLTSHHATTTRNSQVSNAKQNAVWMHYVGDWRDLEKNPPTHHESLAKCWNILMSAKKTSWKTKH